MNLILEAERYLVEIQRQEEIFEGLNVAKKEGNFQSLDVFLQQAETTEITPQREADIISALMTYKEYFSRRVDV